MPLTKNNINVEASKSHPLDFDQLYDSWGACNLTAADAKSAGYLTIGAANPEAIDKAMKTAQKLTDLRLYQLSGSGQVQHYQGNPNKHPAKNGVLLRFTKDGNLNIGSEHISFVIDVKSAKPQLLGMVRMLTECDNAKFVSPNTALKATFNFLKTHAPDLITVDTCPTLNDDIANVPGQSVTIITHSNEGTKLPELSLGNVVVRWIAPHSEKMLVDGKEVTTDGMKVKMQFTKEENNHLFAWAIIDKNGEVQVYERNIAWQPEKHRRLTQMPLHDRWLKKHGILFATD